MTASIQPGIAWKGPDGTEVVISHLVADFNGTLAVGGKLSTGVAERLTMLAKFVEIHVLTADTYGTAAKELKSLPLTLGRCEDGKKKREFVEQLAGPVVAVGNGRNDIEMFKQAQLTIGVMSGEGLNAGLLQVSTIVVSDIIAALDLLLSPSALWATTRP